MMVCTFNSAALFCGALSAMDNVIDAKVLVLKHEKSEIQKVLASRYGYITAAYKMATAKYFFDINQKIKKLESEKKQSHAKL